MGYSNIFGSKFPSEIIPVGTKKDIDDSVKILISQYYSLIDSGNITEANKLYNTYKESLEPYMVNSAYFNRLSEEIYNASLMVLNGQSTIVSDREPAEQTTNSHWLKEY